MRLRLRNPAFRIPRLKKWQARRDSNPQPAVLETAALPIELLAYNKNLSAKHVRYVKQAWFATATCTRPSPPWPALLARILHPSRIILPLQQEGLLHKSAHATILDTTPAPTVRPPSRMANRKPSSMAMGAIKATCILMLSPGMTISTPSGSLTLPVTSVVRK
jgi:hypothetical protein